MKLHLFAHNNEQFVKEGDTVEAYKTKLGTIGTANGSYWAHLHYSVSEGLTVPELRRYINGWSVDKVKQYYTNPVDVVDIEKMFSKPVDVGLRGYGWLQKISNGSPHPGQDINGLGGGNTDIGYEYTSPVNGKVIYVNNTTQKDGWGKMLVVAEDNNLNTQMAKKQYYINSDLRNALKKINDDFNHEKESDHKRMADEVEFLITAEKVHKDEIEKQRKEIVKLNTTVYNREQDIRNKKSLIDTLNETIEKLEKEEAKSEDITLGYHLVGIWNIIRGIK